MCSIPLTIIPLTFFWLLRPGGQTSSGTASRECFVKGISDKGMRHCLIPADCANWDNMEGTQAKARASNRPRIFETICHETQRPLTYGPALRPNPYNFMTTPVASANGPFIMDAVGDLEPLRQAFARAGYTEAVLERASKDSLDLPVMLRATAAPNEANTISRLFMLGQTVPEDRARQALAPMPLEPLIACGLLVSQPAGVKSIAKLVPYEDIYFVSDFIYPIQREPMAATHVLGVGTASHTLSALTVRRNVELAFDLGAGAGVQSVLAARHSQTVIGTDINERALNFAAFNARLNGISNIQWRLGSYFEPVQNETFDLLVANPPFVISPESAYLYRDGGLGGDTVSEHVVRGAAQKLREGGYATMLINWHHNDEKDWEERPRAWFAGNGCDCWVIRSADSKPLTYAASWLRFNESKNPEHYGQLLDQWLAYYDRLGIKGIAAGAVIMHKRRASANWIRCDTTDNVQGTGRCGPVVERIFAAEDNLQRLTQDADMLNQHLLIHPDVLADQRLSVRDGTWAVDSVSLSLREGFPFAGNADIHVLRLLAGCNGKRSLRELVQSMAAAIEKPFDSIVPACLAVARKMVRSGMLTFVEPPAQ